MNKDYIKEGIKRYLSVKYGTTLNKAEEYEIFNALSLTLLEGIIENWNGTNKCYSEIKNAYYFSSEYLMGRALGNNLMNLGIYNEVKEVLEELNIDINKIENIEEDAGLGNGGLGRLSACFMDSAATMEIPLNGYGIRYSNGLFRQVIENGAQKEEADSWLKYGDPWSIRKQSEKVQVSFSDMVVNAIPYDTPIIGYKNKNINTLRLWKCETLKEFDFNLFNEQKYAEAVQLKNKADDISRVLYPNDSNREGKLLRLRQQYFLVSASLQDIIRRYKNKFKKIDEKFSDFNIVQLNDTHPVLAIPELIRLLVDEEKLKFEQALKITKKSFGYTNHTILAEALEKWDEKLIKELFPRILEIIYKIDEIFIEELKKYGYKQEEINEFRIVKDGVVRMANLAIYISVCVNGVAELHTNILKDRELNNWYKLYPNKFQNKTNGITPRRWIRLSNKELSSLITELLGSEDWVKDLEQLKKLEKFKDNEEILNRILQIKHIKKQQLADYIKEKEGIQIDPNSFFDIQVKRLHEYKRQLLNAFYILDLYYRLKEDPSMDIPKITFIFGAKAFPGYKRAIAIVRYINSIANMINNDKDINDKIKVVFVENFGVSYGEKIYPAADLSKQISTAGKEASGTGNMKFMLNGAPTFGTYDGANVEIVRESGKENNFIFGLEVEDIDKLKNNYDVNQYYNNDKNLKKVLDTLIDGTFDDNGTGEFEDLYNSLMKEGDQYFLIADFKEFKEMEDKVLRMYKNKINWAKMCFENICNAGIFSSDRTIVQYANEIWNIKSCANK